MTIHVCPHCHKSLTPRAVAKAAGNSLYTALRPCKRCGNTLRYTSSGNCFKCHADRNRHVPSKAEQMMAAIEKSKAIG